MRVGFGKPVSRYASELPTVAWLASSAISWLRPPRETQIAIAIENDRTATLFVARSLCAQYRIRVVRQRVVQFIRTTPNKCAARGCRAELCDTRHSHCQ